MTPAAAPRLRLRVRGVVQGVGFRPYAHGLAEKFGVAGFVRNDGEGVEIEVEGAAAGAFARALREAPPPLARIECVEVEPCAAQGDDVFAIVASRPGATGARIGADAAICEACLDDLFDPASRFHLYPLVACAHCGPRYTATSALPYDRARTAMAPFPLCASCARDYADPRNRRFHAETFACGDCGPSLDAPLDDIVACLTAGGVAAVKGLGGFHLMCDARDEAAVARLRARKRRESKPFAAMILNAASAALFAEAGVAQIALLADRAAPIVLMRAKPFALAPNVAPCLGEIGLMRAYAPLHWLIFHALLGRPDGSAWRAAPCDLALVATSANLGGEPILADDAEARARLCGVADLVVGHGRAIVARADDSVMRMLCGAPAYLRRARGTAPEPLDLGREGPSVLACGGDLKNTICLTRGREAFVSPHLGDLDNRATLRARAETLRHLQSLLGVTPEYAACDLHPNFVSAGAADGLPCVRVQHHVAHVAACAAEAGWMGPVLGVALDGFGYGADGGAWGGELIRLDGADWRRLSCLAPLPLPGGDKAAREPWRMAVAALHTLGRGAEAAKLLPGAPDAARLADALARGARAPETTSLGRMFDAAAALAGVRLRQDYEGQAAMELEALAGDVAPAASIPRAGDGPLDLAPLLASLIGLPKRDAARLFHCELVAALAGWVDAAARREGLGRVALGGGCLMNRILAEGLIATLRGRGWQVALPHAAPANDGGLSFGQAAFAIHALA